MDKACVETPSRVLGGQHSGACRTAFRSCAETVQHGPGSLSVMHRNAVRHHSGILSVMGRYAHRDLPWNMESITGYNIIEAESLDAAEKLAQSNPFIASIRIYEMRSM
jgi:hypothetical protein